MSASAAATAPQANAAPAAAQNANIQNNAPNANNHNTPVAPNNVADLNNLFIQSLPGPVNGSLMTSSDMRTALLRIPNDTLVVETSCAKLANGTPSGIYQNHIGSLFRDAHGNYTMRYKNDISDVNFDHLFLCRLNCNDFSWPLPDPARFYVRIMTKTEWMSLVLAFCYANQQVLRNPQPVANGHAPPQLVGNGQVPPPGIMVPQITASSTKRPLFVVNTDSTLASCEDTGNWAETLNSKEDILELMNRLSMRYGVFPNDPLTGEALASLQREATVFLSNKVNEVDTTDDLNEVSKLFCRYLASVTSVGMPLSTRMIFIKKLDTATYTTSMAASVEKVRETIMKEVSLTEQVNPSTGVKYFSTRSSRNNGSSSTIVCRFCHKRGHTIANCYAKKNGAAAAKNESGGKA
jgi:hypothetical protein